MIFRENTELALRLKELIHKFTEDLKARYGKIAIRIMNFCGTHEWTTTHYGLRTLMPRDVELVAGPGCPVCITPAYYIDVAIKLALDGVKVYTYGDTYRLPTVRPKGAIRSLADAKAAGADVTLVYSFLEAARDASKHSKDSVFVGIGFETIAPAYAELIMQRKVPENLKFLNIIRLTPPAAVYSINVVKNEVLEGKLLIGVIAPGHVSTITGAKAWSVLADEYKMPTVISGFEPIDVLMSITEILRQFRKGEAKIVIQYKRAVTWDGNVKAQKLMNTVFSTVDAAWRGIGYIPKSGYRLRDNYYDKYDALNYFGIPDLTPETWKYDLPPGCRCADVILGKAKPTDCKLFMKKCRPDSPWGPCMVSLEGSCSIWARCGVISEEVLQDLEFTS